MKLDERTNDVWQRAMGRRLAAAAALLMVACARLARAEDDAYCRRTRARAGDDSALLMWPRLLAEGVRIPGDTAAVGPTFGDNYQVRLGVSFSPTDLYRGLEVGRVADASCRLHEASEQLEALLEGSTDTAVAALRAQAAALESHRSAWNQLLADSRERLRAGVVTALEVDDLRRNVSGLERKLERARAEAERLEARRAQLAPAQPLEVLAAAVTRDTMQLESESTRLRALDGFQVRLSGGVIPSIASGTATTAPRSEWFARVELSYSLGALASSARADDYLDARRRELETARYELPARAADRAAVLRAQISSAQRSRELLEADEAALGSMVGALDRAPGAVSDHARGMLALEGFSVEADRVFVSALIEALNALETPDEPTGVARRSGSQRGDRDATTNLDPAALARPPECAQRAVGDCQQHEQSQRVPHRP